MHRKHTGRYSITSVGLRGEQRAGSSGQRPWRFEIYDQRSALKGCWTGRMGAGFVAFDDPGRHRCQGRPSRRKTCLGSRGPPKPTHSDRRPKCTMKEPQTGDHEMRQMTDPRGGGGGGGSRSLQQT